MLFQAALSGVVVGAVHDVHGVTGLDLVAGAEVFTDAAFDVVGPPDVHVLALRVLHDVDTALGLTRCRFGDRAVVHQDIARRCRQVEGVGVLDGQIPHIGLTGHHTGVDHGGGRTAGGGGEPVTGA
ncbi:Uncharacterised protein [Mycobacteroides abscessus subsp. abscessus]|nr:Uncharacterised protein [Mycobacteroides abscessus subsp. abscessus]